MGKTLNPTLPLVGGWRQCSAAEPPSVCECVCEWVNGTVTVKRFGVMTCCEVFSFPVFSQELHAAFNRLSDLFNVSFLQKLQLLDLEGNDVDDLVHVQCLQACLMPLLSLNITLSPIRRLQAVQKKGSPLNLRHKEGGDKDSPVQNADGAHSSVQCSPSGQVWNSPSAGWLLFS
uniref:Uncharacterized protein n=1 Tax=Oryzias sinensis TaxID=183150 RepID=A0A8C8DRR6_9TELE